MKSALSLKECLFLNRIYGMSASFRRIANAVAYPSPPASAPSSGPENGGGLLVIQPEIRDRLSGMARRLCHDPNLHEDILQEALLCLWRAEVGYPGQTASWYLQRCASCIRDYLRKGRSVDSRKRSRLVCSIEQMGVLDIPSRDDVVQHICEHDEFDELMHRLGPAEQETLRLLRQELTLQEIGLSLRISHVAVMGRRRHIRTAAASLGIGP
jgi:RNA polymerase sigma factor (sigma-70 family)